MKIAEYLKANTTYREYRGGRYQNILAPIECADGFRMSVQGSSTHYCSPREDGAWWYEVEVGFPSAEEPLLMPYAEDSEKPTETVYGYVPVSVVDEVIAKHGGMKEPTDA